jgi:hypothetical protein
MPSPTSQNGTQQAKLAGSSLTGQLALHAQRAHTETLYDFRHKLRNVGLVFASNYETKKLRIEIALKQGRGKHALQAKKNRAF